MTFCWEYLWWKSEKVIAGQNIGKGAFTTVTLQDDGKHEVIEKKLRYVWA